MRHAATLRTILRNDPRRWHALGLVRALDLPDCWIGAGFIRNAIWDHLHDRPATPPRTDIDVLWFDTQRANPDIDRALQAALRLQAPELAWSVKNQARMHTRNGDPPYASVIEAMRHWPETATAVAARRTAEDHCEIAAPFGLEDLFTLIVRPTCRFQGGNKHAIFLDRVQTRRWMAVWPRLRLESARYPIAKPASGDRTATTSGPMQPRAGIPITDQTSSGR